MAKIAYVPKTFYGKSEGRIRHADAILTAYTAQGLTLTLRQLYYQFVARGLLENTMANYKQLQQLVNDARLAGRLDWLALEDRTRNLERVPTWDSPADIVRSASRSYKEDLWRNQDVYCEVWVEKDALAGVVERAANVHRTPFFSCRGYTSQSEVWGAAQRFKDKHDKRCVIVHLGDHDPSGCDMTRDITERLQLTFGVPNIEVNRIALNMDQIRKYNPPPNPAKLTDSRCEAYMAEHGDKSWELDALEPNVLHKLIVDTVQSYVDSEQWNHDAELEASNRTGLQRLTDRYGEVHQMLDDADQGYNVSDMKDEIVGLKLDVRAAEDAFHREQRHVSKLRQQLAAHRHDPDDYCI